MKKIYKSIAFFEKSSIMDNGCIIRGKELKLKTFFDGIFIDNNKLKEEEINHPIKLEYYKTMVEEENVAKQYGIEIVKTEYIKGDIKVESSIKENITNNANEIDNILTVLRNNEVTPIGMQDVLDEIMVTL